MFNIKYIRIIINVLLLMILCAGLQASDGSSELTGSWWSILPPLLAISLALLIRKLLVVKLGVKPTLGK